MDDRMMALYFLAFIGVFLTFVVVGATYIASIAWKNTKSGAASTFSYFIRRSDIIRLITVILIIISAVFLRLIDRISADATITLLSSVAGFILGTGGMSKEKTEESKNNTVQTEDKITPEVGVVK